MFKKSIIVLALSVCMLSIFTLSAKNSKAATLPQVMFTDNGKVFVSVADLGTIFGSEWEIIAINDFPIGPAPFGLGFRYYNTTYNAAEQTINQDSSWLGAAMAYIWAGDGTQGYLSLTNGIQSVRTLTLAPPIAPPPTFKLPDTGQTQDFTPTFGEDSDYTINPPSYTDNGDGTVTDNNTFLMWQQEDDDVPRSWSSAVGYCTSLSLAGHSDWRLPEHYELKDIVNYGNYNPAIDETYFPNTDSSNYWSYTADAYAAYGFAWDVDFDDGTVHHGIRMDGHYVRCVRGGQNRPDFTDHRDGTVTDNNTFLMWQQEDDDVPRNWSSALNYCEFLSLAGHSDWRLPNSKELGSIVDTSVYNPAIDAAYFPNTDSSEFSGYWSSTSSTDESYTNFAWYVEFYHGIVSPIDKRVHWSVRCARGGQ